MIVRTISRLALSALVLLSAAAWSAPPTLDNAWGTSGSAAGALLQPGGIADGPDATVFVADTGNNRIQRFAADGTPLAAWDGTDGGGMAFEGPTDVAVDQEAGEVYVVDSGNDRVGVYAIDGTHLRDLVPGDGFDWPYAVALDPADGTVWVSDMNRDRVVAFPSAGGDQAYGEGSLARPAGIAVADDGGVYIADKNNQRIALLDPATSTVSLFADGDGVVGAMVEPFDVEIDAFGRVHVVDAATSRIREYAADGSLADTWSSQTSLDGQVDIPRGLTITAGDIAHVADYGDDRIERYIGLNNPPTVSDGNRSLLEDAALTFAATDFTDGFLDADGHAPATFRLESAPAQGMLTHDGEVLGDGDTILLADFDQLTYTPPADFFGSASFTWNLSDSVAWAETPASMSLTVQPVNDQPSFTVRNPPPVADEDAGEQVVANWLSIDPGAANEAGQTLTFTVSNVSDPSAFETLPTVAPDTGTLTYETAANVNGDFTFDLRIGDSGGNANGGDPVGPTVTDIPITVTAVNDPPIFVQGTSADVTIDEDGAPRAFVLELSATDVDGDNLTWGIGTVPGHGNAGVSGSGDTRQINYQPAPDYNGPDAFTVVVSDGIGEPAVFSIDLTVAPVNDPPELSGTPSATVAEDEPWSFTPTASDPDVDDSLTFSIAARPAWAEFNTATGRLRGTPGNADVGTYSGIEITATDESGASATLGPFSIEVTNVNNAPAITNAPATTVREDEPYDYTPQVTEPDAGDTATFTIDNPPAWATFDTRSGRLSGTPGAADVGTYEAIRITVTDREGLSDSVGPFAITVIEVDDPPHTITAPPDLTVDATGLYTRVDLESDGAASASDEEDGPLSPRPIGLTSPAWLRPGSHTVEWSVTDSGGNTVVDEQIVEIRPRVGLGPDRTVQEGTTLALPIMLNGDPIDGTTPRIEFDVAPGGSAGAGDYAGLGEPGSVTILGGRTGFIDFDILDDGTGEEPQTLVIELTGTGGDTVLAERTQTTITIVETNTAPIVSLSAAQGGISPAVVIDGTSASPVTVTADVSDATAMGDMTFAWNGGATGLIDLRNDADPATFEFDPTTVAAGVYRIEVTASDDDASPMSGTARLNLRVIRPFPALTADDTDGDGTVDNDAAEGRADRDGDDLPDYRDPYVDQGTIHQTLADDRGYLIETETGLSLELGPVAFEVGADGAAVSAGDIARTLGPRDDRENIGGYFDFTVRGLPTPGGSASVVIPQRQPIPAEAVYRKIGGAGGWRDFRIDRANALASARGAEGFCPPPDALVWRAGLTAGDWCVRLTIEDGGPNDTDMAADGRITDPGGVARGSSVGEGGAEASNSGGGAPGPLLLLLLAVGVAMANSVRGRRAPR